MRRTKASFCPAAWVVVLCVIPTAASSQAPSPVRTQVERGLDLCLRFARRQLDDSVQYHGDQVGFRPTGDYRVQRWADPVDPALWVEVEADGAQMRCDVRVSPAAFASPQAAIDVLTDRYEPRGFRRSTGDAGPFAVAWLHDREDGLIALTVKPDAYLITLTP